MRENYKFIDENGRLTEVNEEGREVAGEKRRDLLDFVRIQAGEKRSRGDLRRRAERHSRKLL